MPIHSPRKYKRVYYVAGPVQVMEYIFSPQLLWTTLGNQDDSLLFCVPPVCSLPIKKSGPSDSATVGKSGWSRKVLHVIYPASVAQVLLPKYLQPPPFLLTCHQGRPLLPVSSNDVFVQYQCRTYHATLLLVCVGGLPECMSMHHGGQKRPLAPLELKFQLLAAKWVGIKSWSSGRTASTPTF